MGWSIKSVLKVLFKWPVLWNFCFNNSLALKNCDINLDEKDIEYESPFDFFPEKKRIFLKLEKYDFI